MIQEPLKLASLSWGKPRGRLGEEVFWAVGNHSFWAALSPGSVWSFLPYIVVPFSLKLNS